MKRFLRGVVLVLLMLSATGAGATDAPPFLVDADWLAARVGDPKLVVLEVRYWPHRYFTVGHIPGAVQVQRFVDLGANRENPIMRLPSREAFQATLRRWGVDDDSTIVIYDDSLSALASRLYFLLDLYGFDMRRVKILDGGTVEWTVFNPLSQDDVRRKPGRVTLKAAKPGYTVEWTDIYRDVLSRRDPKIVLLDARPQDMYTGARIQHAIRGGHIPGAVNVVSLDGVDGQSQRWKSKQDIAALYAAIPKDKTVYVYCHDGFRSTLAWLQLKMLGYTDVRLYNGGWSDWGSNLTLPVVEGEAPYDDNSAL